VKTDTVHVEVLLRSYCELTGRDLVEPGDDQAKRLDEAPFFVASHGMEDDPVLDYGNRCALQLFEMKWEDFVKTPSRLTAEAPNRAERQRLLERVTEHGFIDDYSGVRISAKGKRFRIRNATVWNLTDEAGQKIGQAATFSEWEYL
jgi:hypothetical protein|tara:strand:- start:5204 stop:5641 length:438 start_codon:yes stop_codon:yes gene_type:complete